METVQPFLIIFYHSISPDSAAIHPLAGMLSSRAGRTGVSRSCCLLIGIGRIGSLRLLVFSLFSGSALRG